MSKELLKPFNNVAPQDVLNGVFSLDAATGARGTLVSVKGNGYKSTDNEGIFKNLSNLDSAFSPRWEVKAKVQAAPSGVKPLGIMWENVIESDPARGTYLYNDSSRLRAMGAVCSGEAVPIVTKGITLYHVGTGVACVNSGAAVDNDVAGKLKVTADFTDPTVFGKFLGNADANGYALLSFSCY